MNELSKIVTIAGLALVAIGILMAFLSKVPGIGKLPGDIMIKKENFTFYFPLATCIILSIVISLFMHFFTRK